MKIKKLNKCLCCNSEDLITHLDLSAQPLANSYREKKEKLDTYELKTNLCTNCFHLQLSIAVDPDLLFKNYLYVSGTSVTLHSYFKWFANYIFEQADYNSGLKILDIACNDGTQLDYLKDKGFLTFGIDPAENLYPISSKNHNVYLGYLDSYISTKWEGEFDFIIAQNVFAHNSNPFGFLKKMKKMLKPNGLIFIQTSQSEMILKNEFDTIYHEHISFFNTKSMSHLANRVGIGLCDVFKTSIHGSSYIFILKNNSQLTEKSKNMLNYEEWNGLYKTGNYLIHANKSNSIIFDFKSTIEEFRGLGYIIIGYGAAAKGNTLLNAAKINLDIIIDDNNLKWNLYTPGSNTPIGGHQDLLQYYNKNILLIPLAWNFYSEIMSKMEKHLVFFNKVVSYKYFPFKELEKIK